MEGLKRILREFIAPTLILTLVGSLTLAALGLFKSVAVGLLLFFYTIFNTIAPLGLFYLVFRLLVRRLAWPPSPRTSLAHTGIAFALLGCGLVAWSVLSLLVYYESLAAITWAALAADFHSEFSGYLPVAGVAGLLAPFLSAAFDRRQAESGV
jgi:hypothetical protein